MSKGLLHEIKKGSVSVMKPLTVESLRTFCNELHLVQVQSPTLYMSKDSNDYITAHITGNKAEIERLDRKHHEQVKERLEATHKRVFNDYGGDALVTYTSLDAEYGRNPFGGDEWLVDRVYLEDEEYDSYDIVVTLEDKFVVTKTYSDETGYCTKRVACIKCEHGEVFDVIYSLKE